MKDMTQEITAFNFGTQELRTVEIDNVTWFVAKDVSDVLGYGQTSNMLKRLDEDEVMSSKLDGMNMVSKLINESGIYSAILGSKLDTAKKFKKWVTTDVLPSIRKHGTYMTDKTIEEALTDPDTLIKLATTIKEERQARLEAEQALEIQALKVEMAEKLLEAPEANISMGDFSKVLANYGIKMGRNTLMKELRNSGWLLQNNTPSAKAMEREIFQVYEKVVKTSVGTKVQPVTTITPKGQEFLIKRVTRKRDDVA